MKKALLLTLLVAALLFTGCSMNTAKMEKSALNTTIQLDKSQYEIIGDVTGKAEITQILFFVMGVKPNYGELSGTIRFGFQSYNTAEAMAIYDAIDNSQGADAIIAPKFKTQTTMFFPFYSKQTVEVTGKAIKLK